MEIRRGTMHRHGQEPRSQGPFRELLTLLAATAALVLLAACGGGGGGGGGAPGPQPLICQPGFEIRGGTCQPLHSAALPQRADTHRRHLRAHTEPEYPLHQPADPGRDELPGPALGLPARRGHQPERMAAGHRLHGAERAGVHRRALRLWRQQRGGLHGRGGHGGGDERRHRAAGILSKHGCQCAPPGAHHHCGIFQPLHGPGRLFVSEHQPHPQCPGFTTAAVWEELHPTLRRHQGGRHHRRQHPERRRPGREP